MLQMKITAASLIGSRSENQDNLLLDYCFKPRLLREDFKVEPIYLQLDRQARLFALADGMGGISCGASASFSAVNSLYKLQKSLLPRKLDFSKLNRNVLRTRGGTTLSMLRLSEDGGILKGEFFSIGDSPMLLCRNKKLYQMNVADNLAASTHRKLTGVELRKAGSVLNQYLGKTYSKEVPVHLKNACLRKGDAIIIASDGISPLSEKSLLLNLSKKRKMKNLAEAIALQALAQSDEYCDNITVIVIEIS